MALIASGSYSGMPNDHLVFINRIYGSVICNLYSMWPSIEWYTIAFVTLNIVSISLIGTAILRTSNKLVVKIFFLVLLFSLLTYLSLLLQFTKVSAICATAGVVLMYDNRRGINYIGAIMFLIAALIRFEAAFLVLIVASPLFFFSLLKRRGVHFDHRLRVVLSIIVIASLCDFIDREYYKSDKNWNYYMEYNSLRGSINDNPNLNAIGQVITNNVLSKADYQLLLNFFPDPDIIDIDVLKEIKYVLDEIPLWNKLINIPRQFYSYFFWLCFLLVLSLSFVYNERSIRGSVPSGMNLAMVGAFAYVALNAHIKERVFISAFFVYILLLPILFSRYSLLKKNVLVIPSIFVLIIWLNVRSYEAELRNVKLYGLYTDQIALIDEYLSAPENKLVPFGTSYKLEYNSPFLISEEYYEQQIYYAGWASHIPLNIDKYDSFNYFMDGNGLLVSKNIFELATGLIVSSISSNSDVDVEPKVVGESKYYLVVEFVPMKNAGISSLCKIH